MLAELVEDLIDEERRILPAARAPTWSPAVVDQALGLGPLEPLLRDAAVTEIMVCGPAAVFVERAGASLRRASGSPTTPTCST